MHINEIIRQGGYNVATIQSTVILMELNDKIKDVEGSRYVIAT